MPTFKLDGQEIPYQPGDTIIRAAWREGIDIPHYCWHPGLSVAANCRMCLVHVTSGRQMMMPVLKWDEKKKAYVDDVKPKLQPACQAEPMPDMEVSTKNEHVKKAHASVQEFLLLNHPVDCPICDQAGECKLQDYWLDHQAQLKRKTTERVTKPKAVRFGPTIVYDAERCVMCTRCIRFCEEVVGDPVLDMRERGNHNEIVVAPGRELNHKYTLMTEHVCPVGALTSKDFRFKARVWFLKSAPGVCTGCARGCNTHVDYDPRYGKVYRLRPRDNMDVNKFWMCDDGMMTYKRIQEDRVVSGLSGRGSAEQRLTVSESLEAAAAKLKGVSGADVAVVFSAQRSSEDNTALATFAQKVLGSDKFYLAGLGGWEADNILRHADNNPNTAGAKAAAGGAPKSLSDLAADVASGAVKGILALGWAAADSAEALASLGRLDAFVTLSDNTGPLTELANVVVPVASFAEMHGTFVNADGRAQTFKRAVAAPMGVTSGWEALVQLAKLMGSDIGFAKVQDVRNAMPAQEASA